MQLGFVHFDREDQKKYLAVLSRISEAGAIDELGIGRIRDFYSDLLFPGVSTLHQHAKYFAVLPLLYKEAVKYRYVHLGDVRGRIIELEKDLTRRLCDGSPGATGITGSEALKSGGYVQYDPMYIYGTALRTYGIVKTENIESAIFYASQKFHDRPDKLPESEREQGDSTDTESYLGFCVCPSDIGYDWKETCSLKLTHNEAAFVRGHILSSPACKDSLLDYLLDNRIVLPDGPFESFIQQSKASLPARLLDDIRLAGYVSDLVEGLFLRYNWLYSDRTDMDMLSRFDRWHVQTFLEEVAPITSSVLRVRISDRGTVQFCLRAIELMEKEDWPEFDRLICKRERSIKGGRYKIGNTTSGFHYNPSAPVHDYKLQFRWGTVRTIVNEILGGLADE